MTQRSQSGRGLQMRRPCRMSVSDVRVQAAGGHGRAQLLLDDLGIVGPGDADPVGDAKDMPIDGKPRHAERVAEDDVGGLASDARQFDQRVHRARHLAAMGLDDLGRHTQERTRLGAEEPGRLNLRLELVGRRPGERAGVRVAAEERRRDLIDALVGALRRQDRRDQELVGVREMQLGVGVRVLRARVASGCAAFRPLTSTVRARSCARPRVSPCGQL